MMMMMMMILVLSSWNISLMHFSKHFINSIILSYFNLLLYTNEIQIYNSYSDCTLREENRHKGTNIGSIM